MLIDQSGALRRPVALVVTALVAGAMLASPAPAFADDPAVVEISISGTVDQVAVDDPASADGMEIRTFVEAEGVLVEVPDDVEVPGASGQAVTLEILGAPALTRAEVLDEVATAEVGDVAEIVGVTPLAEGGTETLAASELGTHTLTILPVYWGATDGATTASLSTLAASTAQYWRDQSAERIVVQPDVRGWAKIADPGSCDESTLMNSALAAHGVAAPSGRSHVVVYLPYRSDCGWAGLGSVSGPYVWVNGTQLVDVLAHEFGHNLGLGHAGSATCPPNGTRVSLRLPVATSCAVWSYGDGADVMGFATDKPSGNLNSALADHLGLATVARPTSGETLTVDLAPLSQTTSLRSVALGAPGGTVYVDFRRATGRDTRAPAWAGVQVHFRTIDPTYGYPTSYLLDMNPSTAKAFTSPQLAVGRTWSVPGTSWEVTVMKVGSTATVRVRPQVTESTAVSAYVKRVYRDLFNRAPDSDGLKTWKTALLSGTPRVAVANSITGSDEYRSGLIRGSYRQYLGRSAEAAGLASWLDAMRRGVTISDMESGFIASDEYVRRAGGTDAAWVRQLYRDVLGRSPSSSEVAGWVQTSRTQGRFSVARGFLMSSEHLATVVDGYYRDILGRRLDSAGRATWVAAIQRGSRLEEIIGSIIASEEYWAGAQA